MARYRYGRRAGRGAYGPRFDYDPRNVDALTAADATGVELIAGNAYVAGSGTTGVSAGTLTFNGQPTTKLVSTAGSTEFVDKTGTWDLSAYEFFDLWAHVDPADSYLNGATGSTVGIFCGTTGFTAFYNARLQSRLRPSVDGWYHIRVHKAQFDFTSGSPSWANIQAIRIRWEAGDALNGTVHISGLRVGTHQRSAIRLYFDDGHDSIHSLALPAMQARGLVGTAGIVTSFIGQPDYMTWAQVRDLADAGWDIVSHTHTHPNLTTLTEAEIRSELSQAKAALVAQGYRTGARCLICPQGGYNNTVDRIAREYHDVVRGGAAPQPSGIPTETYPAWHPRDMRYYSVADTDTPASVITKIDDTIAAGGVTSPTWHVIRDGAPLGSLEYSLADFETVLDHIVTERDGGNLDVLLMTNPWFR